MRPWPLDSLPPRPAGRPSSMEPQATPPGVPAPAEAVMLTQVPPSAGTQITRHPEAHGRTEPAVPQLVSPRSGDVTVIQPSTTSLMGQVVHEGVSYEKHHLHSPPVSLCFWRRRSPSSDSRADARFPGHGAEIWAWEGSCARSQTDKEPERQQGGQAGNAQTQT